MNFAVNGNAVVCNMLDGEIRARMASRNNPEKMFYWDFLSGSAAWLPRVLSFSLYVTSREYEYYVRVTSILFAFFPFVKSQLF